MVNRLALIAIGLQHSIPEITCHGRVENGEDNEYRALHREFPFWKISKGEASAPRHRSARTSEGAT